MNQLTSNLYFEHWKLRTETTILSNFRGPMRIWTSLPTQLISEATGCDNVLQIAFHYSTVYPRKKVSIDSIVVVLAFVTKICAKYIKEITCKSQPTMNG